jgi:hypothetical protein
VKTLVAALCLALSLGAYAQDKKEPTEAQKKQQQLMKDCNDKAGGKKGDERKIFLSTCLKDGANKQSEAQKKQQERMSACNKQAAQKNLSGEARKSFMSSCLKGG